MTRLASEFMRTEEAGQEIAEGTGLDRLGVIGRGAAGPTTRQPEIGMNRPLPPEPVLLPAEVGLNRG